MHVRVEYVKKAPITNGYRNGRFFEKNNRKEGSNG